MPRIYKPHIPDSPSELIDLLAMMVLESPSLNDKTGYFPEQNIETVFYALIEGLKINRSKLGEELYLQLRAMSDQMRIHFEADPENKTDETLKGRDIIYQMEALITPLIRDC
jgi:hypothetical protein